MSAVYEAVILFGVVFFFAYAFSALTSFKGGESLLRSAFQIYLFLILGAYFTWFWSGGRRTLPMKTMGVTLVAAATGEPLTAARAAWRYLVASILFWGLLAAVWKASAWWLVLWPLPFLWSLVNSRHQALYDLVAGSLLVRTTPSSDRAAR
ncbi:MAG: RDD family protein [Lautropia sp.]|nr:RDD family protein [Lautropia sp.]